MTPALAEATENMLTEMDGYLETVHAVSCLKFMAVNRLYEAVKLDQSIDDETKFKLFKIMLMFGCLHSMNHIFKALVETSTELEAQDITSIIFLLGLKYH